VVRVSHARCRRCGQTRHRNAKRNLCGQCWSEEKHHVRQGWRDIKDRRALKRAQAEQPTNGHIPEEVIQTAEVSQAAVQAATPPDPTASRGGKRRAHELSPEQVQEIIDLYTQTDTSVPEIASTYGVSATFPYLVLSRAGITWRRGDSEGFKPEPKRELPPHIEAMKEIHVATPTSAPAPAPTANEKAPVGEWQVEFTGAIKLHAISFDEAVRLARANGAVEITMIRRLS